MQFKRPRAKPFAERFIRLDGTGWHAGELRSTFQSVSVRTAAACAAVIAGVAAVGPDAVADTKTLLMTGGAMMFMAMSGLVGLSDERRLRCTFVHKSAGYAIDREGRSIPPANMPELLNEIEDLRFHNTRSVATAFKQTALGIVGTTILAAATMSATPSFVLLPALVSLPYMARSMALQLRCDRLLADRYRFCGTPPGMQSAAHHATATQHVPRPQ